MPQKSEETSGQAPGNAISATVATTLVVANMIGTGVFTSLGYQVADLPGGFPILLLWTLGGAVAFCGAVCYAELGAMMPRSGGEYHLLRESLHPFAGFAGGWVSVFAGFAAPIAAAGLAFGGYLTKVIGAGDEKALAAAVTLAVGLVHVGKLRHIGRFQMIFTTFKVLLILSLIGAAFFLAPAETRQPVGWLPRPGDGALLLRPAFAVSLYWVMYAYAGWNASAYIAAEIRDPRLNLPRSLLAGTLIVTALYVALNVAFLHVAPLPEIAGQKEVALIAARHIFGERGGDLMGLLICFGLISAISAMTWAGPRVLATIGEDYRAFRWFGKRNRHDVPARAVLAQTALVLLFVTARFDELIHYVQSLITLASLLVVAAVIHLRHQQPDRERPFRAWGYPLTPLIFIVVSLYMLWVETWEKPREMAAAAATLALGGFVYFFTRRTGSDRPPTQDDSAAK
ncbi:MAG: APC family permease [Verrucomicrobiae bacterium]|nr:APC family permease [Verrucomicrobiae bacterium]MCP5541728.1 APC family permease [Akkermansiaceae bacterium]MCP5551745.1 APC family permease [Akkermansiaceae bacterium]